MSAALRAGLPVVLFVSLFWLVPASSLKNVWLGGIFCFTYLLDGFLFFYYKKNQHLNVARKNAWLLGVRLVLCLLFLL